MCDIPAENTFVMQNGEILSICNGIVKKDGKITINDIYVDGNRIGEISSSVIKDRKIMSTDGVLVVILNIDTANRKLVIDPNVTTRGFVIVNENSDLLNTIQQKVKEIVNSELLKPNFNIVDLKNRVILEINSYIIDLTGRRPIILPMILEVKTTVK